MELMTLEEMKQHEWCVSWSGGKDSTATIIKMHELGIPIKEIIYVRMMFDENIPATLPVMTDSVDECAERLRNEWGYKVTIVKSIKSAMELANTVYKKSKYEDRNGNKYGITAFGRRCCKMTGAKQRTIQQTQKQIKSEYSMLGLCADELPRLNQLVGDKQSILATLGIEEKDVFEICREYGMLSPLYDTGFAQRDGCFFCPNCRNTEMEYSVKNYPELIEKIRTTYDMSYGNYDIVGFLKNGTNQWGRYFHDCDEMGIDWRNWDKYIEMKKTLKGGTKR